MPVNVTLLPALAAAILATASVASAQDEAAQPTPNYTEMEDAETVEQFERTVDELDDLDVYGAEGEVVGEIEEVLASPDGEPVAFAVETDSLLQDDFEVVVPFEELQLVGERFVTALTQEEIEAMPRWDG